MNSFPAGELVLLSHGGGGRRMKALIRDLVLRHLGNPLLDPLDDGACFPAPGPDLVFTTDSYVVTPLFFPGGDIGRLAVCGTVNDLAMMGAMPRALSLALILEEGLPLADLDRLLASAAAAAREAGAPVATGDTKVVERGKGNGVFITTAGIGARRPGADTRAGNARPGDAVLVSGTLGDHGIAVLGCRPGLSFKAPVASDVAPLNGLVAALLEAAPGVRVLRDPTRGGLAAALCDIAEASGVCLRIRDADLPVRPAVRAACGLLGLDVLSVANEGKAVVLCPPEQAAAALAGLRAHALGRAAAVIGAAAAAPAGAVILETEAGGERLVDLPLGEDLPRIC